MTPPLWYSLLLSVALATAAAGWAALACGGAWPHWRGGGG
jgi:hypothetical protein